MPKAQPDHWYGSGHTCLRCGMKRRPVRHSDGTPTSFTEWSADGGKTWTRQHTACPMRKPMEDKKTREEKYPLCTKVGNMHESKGATADFIDWLQKNGYVIAYERDDGDLVLPAKNFDRLWLDYIEVDPEKLEEERRAMLDAQRKLNDKTSCEGCD